MSGGLGGWSRTTPSTSFLNAMRSAIVHRMIFLDVRCISEAAVYREFRNSFSGKLLRNSTSLVRGINGLYLSQNDELHRYQRFESNAGSHCSRNGSLRLYRGAQPKSQALCLDQNCRSDP